MNAILGDLTTEEAKVEIACAVEKATNCKTVDLVIGGPPCKGFSSANRMTRDDSNPLNNLALYFAEMVRRMNPFAFVMENVPGMLSLHGGRILGAVKDDLRKQGYENTDHCVLNAADYGVPQKRMRMFLMGSKSQMRIEPPKKNARGARVCAFGSCVETVRDRRRCHRRPAWHTGRHDMRARN